MAHGKWSEVEARGVLEAWRRSGLQLEKFARQRGFVAQRLRWWRDKFNRAEKASLLGPRPAVLPVHLSAESSRRGEPVTVLLRTGSSGNALLRKTVLGSVNHPKLSFSAFFPSVTFTKGIIAIATLDVSSSHYFTLNLRDQGAVPAASLEEFVGATMTRHVLTKLPPAGVWTRITVDLDFTTGKANVSFGADKALTDEPIMAAPGTETTIRLGAVYFEGPADPFLARFDDVVVEF